MFSEKIDENLELRLHSPIYAEELVLMVNENLDHLHQWLPWATDNYSLEIAKEFIKTSRETFAEQEIPGFFIFENDQLVGGIGFNSPDRANKSIEIGYWLGKNATGKGIVTKCCRFLISFVFEELEFNRIVIRCGTENLKSQAIPVRLGFKKEGVARQAQFLHGKFFDLIIYSMLKEEWE